MRILLILVERAPEEGSHDASAFNGPKWQSKGPDHGLV
jgi:hypothetical protein